MKKFFIFILIILCNLNAQAKTSINIYVSILPLKYFVQQIGGDKVNVAVMVGSGQSPETYAPTPQQMTQLSNTQNYYRVGVPFERAWLNKIHKINPEMRIVDLRYGIKRRYLGEEIDPHIWTNPILVIQMAKTIRNSLIKIDPNSKKIYAQNYLKFSNKLKELSKYIKAKFTNLKSHSFLAFHPAWGYFAAEYGLKQIAIEKEGKTPGPRDLARIVNLAKEEQIRIILVQPQFSRAKAEMIANAIHAKVVVADPLKEDYLTNMYHVTNMLIKYLRN